MKFLEELRYAKSHEWVRVEGKIAYIGISDYAQEHLGEVVFVDLPEVNTEIIAGDQFVVLESVKAVSDVFSPISGKVVEINEELLDNPALVNESPYEAFLVAIEMSDASEVEELLSASDYEATCE